MLKKYVILISVIAVICYGELVRINLYYMNFCPYSRIMYSKLIPLTSKLANYIDLHTYPFGGYLRNNSGVLSVDPITPREGYGNRLHQCATEALVGLPTPKGSPPLYIEYNNCVIQNLSTPATVDECAKQLNVSPVIIEKDIRACANSDIATYLMIRNGLLHKRDTAGFKATYPFLLINDKKVSTWDLVETVCGLLKNPPPVCSE